MKKVIIIILCSISVVSCSDWLKAVSSTQFQERDMFLSREGFQDALTGVYLLMGDYKLYGGYASWYVLDELVYPYNTITGSDFQPHDYSKQRTVSFFDEMWNQYYNVIVNINAILSHMDGSRAFFSCDEEYDLYYGELLGLRAFLHFDLMRIYGLPIWSGENESKLTVPFQLEFSPQVPSQLTYTQAEEQLFKDLNASIEYLSVDPVRGLNNSEFDNLANTDGYWNYRNLHFNYYAALALKARILQWKQDYEGAAATASIVIKEAFESNAVSWVDCSGLLEAGLVSSKDWSFSTEHIFALDVTDNNYYTSVLFGLGMTSGSKIYTIPEKIVKRVLYPDNNIYGQMSGAEDIRGTAFQLRFYSNSYVCYKLYCESTTPFKFRNKRPLIKIAEMYYIMAENALIKGDNKSAIEYLNVVRKARNIQSDLPEIADAEDELNKEHYREFINEGQLFFWLKHHGLDDYLGEEYMSLSDNMLILPYPTDELSYGRVQEK